MTPLAKQPNDENIIFMNSAGASLMSIAVVQSIKNYLDLEAQVGGYEVMIKHQDLYQGVYAEAAKLLNCHAKNIALCESATNGYNNAISAIPFEHGDKILTSILDYSSNYMLYHWLQKRFGVTIHFINNGENEEAFDLNHAAHMIKTLKPKLVSVAHIPTNSGTIQDINGLGQVCFENDVLFAVDACQSVGQICVDVSLCKCDILTVTGRKFLRGPRGTGILFVSDKMLEVSFHPFLLDGNGSLWQGQFDFQMYNSAKRYEPFEHSLASFAGLGQALIELNEVGVNNIENYNKTLANYTREKLTSIDGIICYDQGKQLSSIITLGNEKWSIDQLKSVLDQASIKYGISFKSMAWPNMSAKNKDWLLRLSPHYFNSTTQVDCISDILQSLR